MQEEHLKTKMRLGAGWGGRWGPDLSILGMLPDLRRHNCGCTKGGIMLATRAP